MYYKIVTEKSFFTDLYNNIDVFNIPNQTVFSAPEKAKYKPDDPKCLINKNCFHFSEGAFDTLLWHTILIHHILDATIYKIKPLSEVTKARCNDCDGIYQCGANKIMILEKQNLDNMYEQAIQEYYQNPNKYTNFKINLEKWKKHEPTVFYLFKSYSI